MEVEEIQTQGPKFPRIGRGGCDFNKLAGQNGEEEDDSNRGSLGTSNFSPGGALGRFCGWPSSRIVRVSRASGGKDRHSKVLTSKGLRDRRVRLSVHTAIQFYDLQDRLGYDQPSKAVEWLLQAAAKSIDELPSINTSFPDTPNQLSDERGSAEVDPVDSAHLNSSNSETSKGSAGQLSLSRTENRIKARERAKERRAEREKEKESESCIPMNNHHLGAAPLSQSSFTELLTGSGEGANLFHKQRQWGSDPAIDYFPMAQYNSQIHHQHHQQQEQQHFPLLSDHMMPTVAATAATDLSFTMSSSSGNMNRGTLQSNSPHSLLLPHHHHHHHHIRTLSPLDGSGVPFFIGTGAPVAASMEQQHHQFPSGFQLYYGEDNGRHLDPKDKGNN